MKYGDIVIYFALPSERSLNNESPIAAAIVSRPWKGASGQNLMVIFDGQSELMRKSSCVHADTMEMAVKGGCWATREEAEGWGLDLTDGMKKVEAV